MANSHKSTDIQDEQRQISIKETSTDSPLIPAETLERLNAFRPDLVDKVIELTQEESRFRRAETKRINSLTFSLQLVGQFFGFGIGLGAVFGGIYCVLNGWEWAGATIAISGITGLAVAFVTGRKN